MFYKSLKKSKFTTVCMEKPLNRDIFSIRPFPVSHNAPYLPPPPPHQILHKLFSFLLSITAVPTEIENNGWAKFGGGGGQISCIWEMCKWRFYKSFYLSAAKKPYLASKPYGRKGNKWNIPKIHKQNNNLNFHFNFYCRLFACIRSIHYNLAQVLCLTALNT